MKTIRDYIEKIIEFEKDKTFDPESLNYWIKRLKEGSLGCPCLMNDIDAGDIGCPEEQECYNYIEESDDIVEEGGEQEYFDHIAYCDDFCRRSGAWWHIKHSSPSKEDMDYLVSELEKF